MNLSQGHEKIAAFEMASKAAAEAAATVAEAEKTASQADAAKAEAQAAAYGAEAKHAEEVAESLPSGTLAHFLYTLSYSHMTAYNLMRNAKHPYFALLCRNLQARKNWQSRQRRKRCISHIKKRRNGPKPRQCL